MDAVKGVILQHVALDHEVDRPAVAIDAVAAAGVAADRVVQDAGREVGVPGLPAVRSRPSLPLVSTSLSWTARSTEYPDKFHIHRCLIVLWAIVTVLSLKVLPWMPDQ